MIIVYLEDFHMDAFLENWKYNVRFINIIECLHKGGFFKVNLFYIQKDNAFKHTQKSLVWAFRTLTSSWNIH